MHFVFDGIFPCSIVYPVDSLTQTSFSLQGGLALGNLASLCAPNRRIVAQTGGISAILKSMKTNLQYPGVQEYGCWALRHLALDQECKAICLREQGPAVIRACMTGKISTTPHGCPPSTLFSG
jgi:hypothetical protein